MTSQETTETEIIIHDEETGLYVTRDGKTARMVTAEAEERFRQIVIRNQG